MAKKLSAALGVFMLIIALTACGAKALPIEEYSKTVRENFSGWSKNVTLWASGMDNGTDRETELLYIAECRKYLNGILAVKTDDGEYVYCCEQIRKGTETELKWCDAAEKVSKYEGSYDDPECQVLMSELAAISNTEVTLPTAFMELAKNYRENTGNSVMDL